MTNPALDYLRKLNEADKQIATLSAQVEQLTQERDTLKAAIGDLLAFADAERETFRVAKDRDQYQFYSGYREAIARVAALSAQVEQAKAQVEQLTQLNEAKLKQVNKITTERFDEFQRAERAEAQVATLSAQVEQQKAKLAQLRQQLEKK